MHVQHVFTVRLNALCLTSGQYLRGRLTSHGWHHHHGNPRRYNHNHPSARTGDARCSLCYHGNSRRLRWTGKKWTESFKDVGSVVGRAGPPDRGHRLTCDPTSNHLVHRRKMSLSPSGGHHDTRHGLVPNGGGGGLQPRPGWPPSCHVTGHLQRHSHRCSGW